MKALVLAIMLAFSTTVLAVPPMTVVVGKKQTKAPVKKAPVKKEDGKIKPLEEGRKVPTLKKKFKKA